MAMLLVVVEAPQCLELCQEKKASYLRLTELIVLIVLMLFSCMFAVVMLMLLSLPNSRRRGSCQWPNTVARMRS